MKNARAMKEDEFRKQLHERHFTLTSVCDLINIKTEAVIKPKHIDKYLFSGTLSEPLTACFRLLFRLLDAQDTIRSLEKQIMELHKRYAITSTI